MDTKGRAMTLATGNIYTTIARQHSRKFTTSRNYASSTTNGSPRKTYGKSIVSPRQPSRAFPVFLDRLVFDVILATLGFCHDCHTNLRLPASKRMYQLVFAKRYRSAERKVKACTNLIFRVVYDNRFSSITGWTSAGIIDEVHAYFDSALVQRVIMENKSGIFKYTDSRMTLKVGPMGSNC
jgi:hypothetical protein